MLCNAFVLLLCSLPPRTARPVRPLWRDRHSPAPEAKTEGAGNLGCTRSGAERSGAARRRARQGPPRANRTRETTSARLTPNTAACRSCRAARPGPALWRVNYAAARRSAVAVSAVRSARAAGRVARVCSVRQGCRLPARDSRARHSQSARRGRPSRSTRYGRSPCGLSGRARHRGGGTSTGPARTSTDQSDAARSSGAIACRRAVGSEWPRGGGV